MNGQTLSPTTQFRISLTALGALAAALVAAGVAYSQIPKREELGALGRDVAGVREEIRVLDTKLAERDTAHAAHLAELKKTLEAIRAEQTKPKKVKR